ncbi:hypothetical protein Syun_009570 [Stephania yunnanensis]|uniref:Secreted protein n=1 Tax=Stephania yunnanensis TaxID=152371 RepID=A0AAP0KER5_9MAGN
MRMRRSRGCSIISVLLGVLGCESSISADNFFALLHLLKLNVFEVDLHMATIPRPPHGHGWLRLAIGTIELSQSIIQAVPFSARKASGGLTEGIAHFLQRPHFNES